MTARPRHWAYSQHSREISAMIEKYRRETIDIEDVEFEEYDLELESLFPDKEQDTDSDSMGLI